MQQMTVADFLPHVNETFVAALNGSEASFVLVEARPLDARPAPGGARQPFSLLFRNTASFLFPQQTYPMRHANMGEFGIFLVPIAREREGFLYQAIFN